MAYEIDSAKVAGVVKEASVALSRHGFNHGEVIVGLSELIGRVIVEVATNHIAMKDMVKVVMEHLDRTIVAGDSAKGNNLIERV